MKITPELVVSILGESGCGKTSLITTVSAGRPELATLTTPGSEHATIAIKLAPDQSDYNILIEGFGGQRDYLDVIKSSERLTITDAILLCFDLSDEFSFDSIPTYLSILNEKLGHRNVPRVLVGLKNDLEWHLPLSRIEERMKETNLQYFIWCSSKLFENVYEPFRLALALHLGEKEHFKRIIESSKNIPYEESQTEALISDFLVKSVVLPCTAEDCNEDVTVEIKQGHLKLAAAQLSGRTELLAICNGNSKIYGPHYARFMLDKEGDIRQDKGAVKQPEVLSAKKKSALILKNMVFKSGTLEEIQSKEEQRSYWRSLLAALDEVICNKIPSGVKRGKETEKDVEDVYHLLKNEKTWNVLPLAKLDDPRITDKDITDFWYKWWFVDRGLNKKKNFFRIYHQLLLVPVS